LIGVLIRDELATELLWEWREGGEPHAATPLNQLIEQMEKDRQTASVVSVTRDDHGDPVALTACYLSTLAGCTEYLNHSGIRIEISFGRGLLPDRQSIQAGVVRLLDEWSH
jgi:hypothetical protein